ncbi:MAG TPA: hypothetical protein VHW26_01125 [Solirubrobacteraceae bacterium]|nr:hypothetical protein [Solirubrobacteraceae bacterium]
MTPPTTTVRAEDVRVGDRVLEASGDELTVTRIDAAFMGRPEMIAYVEDTPARWRKLPMMVGADVEIVRTTPA